jgi:hypothetical protein
VKVLKRLRGSAFLFMASLSLALADPLQPAPETGACSLEDATPVTVALVDDDLDLLLDDGSRVTLARLEYPAEPALREAALKAPSDWLAGRQAFLAVPEPAAGAARRGGRSPPPLRARMRRCSMRAGALPA